MEREREADKRRCEELLDERAEVEPPARFSRAGKLTILIVVVAATLSLGLAMVMPEDAKLRPVNGRAELSGPTTVQVEPLGLSFDIPQRWVEHNDRFENNLHLGFRQLREVSAPVGEWDVEYAALIDDALSFGACAAHVGGEGWGAESVSYGDLQLRAYVFWNEPRAVVAAVRATASIPPAELFAATREYRPHGHPVRYSDEFEVETGSDGEWERIAVTWDVVYGDYGGTAVVDARVRQVGKKAAVLVFMYERRSDSRAQIDGILDSVEVAERARQ